MLDKHSREWKEGVVQHKPKGWEGIIAELNESMGATPTAGGGGHGITFLKSYKGIPFTLEGLILRLAGWHIATDQVHTILTCSRRSRG